MPLDHYVELRLLRNAALLLHSAPLPSLPHRQLRKQWHFLKPFFPISVRRGAEIDRAFSASNRH